ncbi:hypothetical protein G9P44_004378 [Scheffersomyces stipitis]|nr:hypothetical protein G9P44_004378 [Scheffersomyces stipitis]
MLNLNYTLPPSGSSNNALSHAASMRSQKAQDSEAPNATKYDSTNEIASSSFQENGNDDLNSNAKRNSLGNDIIANENRSPKSTNSYSTTSPPRTSHRRSNSLLHTPADSSFYPVSGEHSSRKGSIPTPPDSPMSPYTLGSSFKPSLMSTSGQTQGTAPTIDLDQVTHASATFQRRLSQGSSPLLQTIPNDSISAYTYNYRPVKGSSLKKDRSSTNSSADNSSQIEEYSNISPSSSDSYTLSNSSTFNSVASSTTSSATFGMGTDLGGNRNGNSDRLFSHSCRAQPNFPFYYCPRRGSYSKKSPATDAVPTYTQGWDIIPPSAGGNDISPKCSTTDEPNSVRRYKSLGPSWSGKRNADSKKSAHRITEYSDDTPNQSENESDNEEKALLQKKVLEDPNLFPETSKSLLAKFCPNDLGDANPKCPKKASKLGRTLSKLKGRSGNIDTNTKVQKATGDLKS